MPRSSMRRPGTPAKRVRFVDVQTSSPALSIASNISESITYPNMYPQKGVVFPRNFATGDHLFRREALKAAALKAEEESAKAFAEKQARTASAAQASVEVVDQVATQSGQEDQPMSTTPVQKPTSSTARSAFDAARSPVKRVSKALTETAGPVNSDMKNLTVRSGTAGDDADVAENQTLKPFTPANREWKVFRVPSASSSESDSDMSTMSPDSPLLSPCPGPKMSAGVKEEAAGSQTVPTSTSTTDISPAPTASASQPLRPTAETSVTSTGQKVLPTPTPTPSPPSSPPYNPPPEIRTMCIPPGGPTLAMGFLNDQIEAEKHARYEDRPRRLNRFYLDPLPPKPKFYSTKGWGEDKQIPKSWTHVPGIVLLRREERKRKRDIEELEAEVEHEDMSDTAQLPVSPPKRRRISLEEQKSERDEARHLRDDAVRANRTICRRIARVQRQLERAANIVQNPVADHIRRAVQAPLARHRDAARRRAERMVQQGRFRVPSVQHLLQTVPIMGWVGRVGTVVGELLMPFGT